MKRREKLKQLKHHAWYKKLFTRLTAQELSFLESFIENHSDLDRNDFDKEIKRMILSSDKPKSWAIIDELLSVINSNR